MIIETGPITHEPLFFSLEDLSRKTGLQIPSVRVWASRKVRSGELLRVRRDLYVLAKVWKEFGEAEFFRLANMAQTPSYVSLLSALSYHGLSTQMVSSVVESMNPVRTRSYEIRGMIFRYHYCQGGHFFGYQKGKGFFIAEAEKAFLDALYLVSLGRYALDMSALDLSQIRWGRIEKWLRHYTVSFRKYFKTWGQNHERFAKARGV